MTEKKYRPTELLGKTYKIAYRDAEKVYITINSFADNFSRPFEIFINNPKSDDAELKALSLMISALLRKCEDVNFIVDSLKRIKSSKGAWFYDKDIDKSVYISSLPHAISYALERFITKPKETVEQEDLDLFLEEEPSERKYDKCPQCDNMTLINTGGCKICINTDCAYGGCE